MRYSQPIGLIIDYDDGSCREHVAIAYAPRNGVVISFHRTGHVSSITEFTEGSMNGRRVMYDGLGELLAEEYLLTDARGMVLFEGERMVYNMNYKYPRRLIQF